MHLQPVSHILQEGIDLPLHHGVRDFHSGVFHGLAHHIVFLLDLGVLLSLLQQLLPLGIPQGFQGIILGYVFGKFIVQGGQLLDLDTIHLYGKHCLFPS